jgi:hypothetical protein
VRFPKYARGVCAPFATAGCAALTLWACSTPTEPVSPPGGGNRYVLDFQEFQTTVSPILTVHGCDAGGGCHGGGIRGTLALSPVEDKDLVFDFEQISLQVDGLDPSLSPVLTKPLALSAGGDPHSYEGFASTDDVGYVAILSWIESGAFAQ